MQVIQPQRYRSIQPQGMSLQPQGAGGPPPPPNDPLTGMPKSKGITPFNGITTEQTHNPLDGDAPIGQQPTVPGGVSTPRPKPQFDPTTGDPIARPSGAITSMQQQHPTAGQGYSAVTPTGSGYRPSGPGVVGNRPGSTLGQTPTLGQQRPSTMGSGGGAINPPPPPPPPVIDQPGQPDGNLRGDAFLPGADPRLQGAMSASDAAAARVQGYDRNAMQGANEGRYRSIYGDGQVSGTMDALNGAPDRTALAKQTLADFQAQGERDLQNKFRGVGQAAAKFGRIGMGDVNAQLGSIAGDYARDLLSKQNELASNVAEGDINDRFRKVDMQTGLAERNADRGFQRTNAALTQAGNQTDRSVGDLYDQNTAAGSLEDRIFGQGQSNRNEYRTERQRQDQQSQQSIENRIREMEAQNNLEDQRLRRAALLQQAGGGY